MRAFRSFLIALVAIAGAAQLRAGGPLSASGTTARRYASGSFPLTYRVDQGTLGAFSNTTATNIVDWSFWEWDSIQSAAISFSRGTQLPRDVNTATDAYISGTGQWTDGVNPMIFDSDGSITDAKLGVGAKSSVLGFATSAWTGTTFVEGYAIINGYLSGSGTTTDEDRYKATIVHEIGHFLGLAHSQVTMHADFATMYPIIQKTAQKNTSPDDSAAIAWLYPATGHTGRVGAISGTVRNAAGGNLSGVVVLAVDSATGASYSSVVDYYSGGNTNAFNSPPAASGSYTIAGLPPGRYYVRIEPPKPEFTGGSSLASYSTPQNTGIAREWYNGAGESGDMLLDDQNQKTAVTVTAGATTSSIAIVANESNTLTTLSHHAATASASWPLPYNTYTGYAVRFTAPGSGSLVGVRVKTEANSTMPLNGTLTVTVHSSAPGSLAGIPGTVLGSVTIPFADLSANQENDIWLRGIGTAANFAPGAEFHVALTTNGVGALALRSDNGATTQNRTSYYTSANGWRNIPQGMPNGTPGYNLQMSAIYSSTLAGNPTPSIALDATALDFGRVRANGTADRVLTISNTGTAALTVSAATVAGADASSFAIVAGGAPFTVAAGGTRSMTVRFTARRGAQAGRSATLSITSDAAGSPSGVSLAGTVLDPVATKLLPSIALGSRRLDSAHASTHVVLRNTGNDTLAIASLALSGADAGAGIRLLSSGGPTRLAPDSTLSVRLELAPTARRSYAATLTVDHDDSVGATTFAISGAGVAPLVSSSRDTLDAGATRVQSGSTAELWLRNAGNATMTLDGFSFIGDSSAFTVVAPSSLPSTILIGDSILVRVRFAPTGRRGYSAVLRARTNAIPATEDVALIGRGIAPVAMAPALAVVGSAVVGATIEEPALAVRNIGDAPLAITTLTVGGAHASEFAAVGVTLPATIAPGDSLPVRIRFTPSAMGARTADLIVASDDPAGGTTQVTLAASGLQGELRIVGGSRLDFGDVTIASTGERLVRLANVGSGPLLLTAATLSSTALFSATTPALPVELAPGDSATITVRFAPAAPGTAGARLSLLTNGVVALSELELVGRGVAPGLALDRSAIAFGAVPTNESRIDSFTVRNSGSTPLTGVSLLLDGAAAGAFAIDSPASPFDIAAGATRTVVVRLREQSSSASLQARVQVSADGGARSEVTLGATIVETMLSTVAAVDFGTRADNAPIDTVIVVRNEGALPLRIDSIAVDAAKDGVAGAYFIGALPSNGTTLAPGTSLELRLRFAPFAGAGSYTGTLTIHTNNPPDSAVAVGLAGAVAPPSNVDDPITGQGMLQVSAVRPNPASTSAWLTIRTPRPTAVVVTITNTQGVIVATPLDGETVGEDHILIDASVLAVGEYLVSVRSGENVATRRMIVTR